MLCPKIKKRDRKGNLSLEGKSKASTVRGGGERNWGGAVIWRGKSLSKGKETLLDDERFRKRREKGGKSPGGKGR